VWRWSCARVYAFQMPAYAPDHLVDTAIWGNLSQLWVESGISFDPAITGELPEEPSGPAAQDPKQ
jgi:hypothetical protein